MIPKILHYCWFGKKKLPALAKKCIASWKKYCPDYELILWNEDNFDLNSNTYVREAYDSGKFAFVTDYVRLWALYRYGGIYMDTDVEVIKSLDKFLVHPAFSGKIQDENLFILAETFTIYCYLCKKIQAIIFPFFRSVQIFITAG